MQRVFEILSCKEGAGCANSLDVAGLGSAKCGVCRFAPNAPSSYSNYWKPTGTKRKHPAAVAEKDAKQRLRLAVRKAKNLAVDRNRQKVLAGAARAEKSTERNLIKATKNSGRMNRDGDHVAAGNITLDTKMQSKRINPVVSLEELFKVRDDAKHAGNLIGALVLRNSNNVGVVAIHEDDFARIVAQLA